MCGVPGVCVVCGVFACVVCDVVCVVCVGCVMLWVWCVVLCVWCVVLCVMLCVVCVCGVCGVFHHKKIEDKYVTNETLKTSIREDVTKYVSKDENKPPRGTGLLYQNFPIGNVCYQGYHMLSLLQPDHQVHAQVLN